MEGWRAGCVIFIWSLQAPHPYLLFGLMKTMEDPSHKSCAAHGNFNRGQYISPFFSFSLSRFLFLSLSRTHKHASKHTRSQSKPSTVSGNQDN